MQKEALFAFVNILGSSNSSLAIRRLAYMTIHGAKPGPVVWLTGCAHGDEVGGMVVIQEIFKKLQRESLLKGSLFAFPPMNPLGFETISRNVSFTNEDLNRSFPGDKDGSLAQRIAFTIFSEITKTQPAIVLDLHNDWIKSIPYTLLDAYPGVKHKEAYEKAKQLAHETGFLVVQEDAKAKDALDLEKTLSGSLLRHDIPALTLELGEAYVVNEMHVQAGVRAILNILLFLGMLDARQHTFMSSSSESFQNKELRYSDHPVSSESGIVRFLVKPGDIVHKGNPIARIYNVFGKLQETLQSQEDGVILGTSDSSVALPGIPVAAFGIM